MALAVASTSTTAAGTANPATVTKPSGVASGDLLVIVAGGTQTASRPGIFSACSGFTVAIDVYGGVGNGSINPDSGLTYLWRIADASDVSASTYSVTNSEAGIAMLRITGWTSGNPFSHTSEVEYTNGTTTVGKTADILRIRAQLLIMAGVNNHASTVTGSAYTITSSNSNPTWTELLDTYNASADHGLQVAYAISSDTSTITAWQYTLSTTAEGVAGGLGIITEPANATSDLSHLSVTPTLEGLTPTYSVISDVSHNAIAPTLEGVTGKASSDGTQWTNEAKPSTNWTNEPK